MLTRYMTILSMLTYPIKEWGSIIENMKRKKMILHINIYIYIYDIYRYIYIFIYIYNLYIYIYIEQRIIDRGNVK